MKTNIFSYIVWLSALLTVLLTGCSSSGNTTGNNIPDWVNNPGNAFSQDKYLMAVGSGSTLNEAKSDAFASLSQIFHMNIDASEEMYSETLDSNMNGKMFSENTLQLLNNIRIGTNQELLNTSILTSDIDNMGTYYALAGMDRTESSRIYNQEIASNTFKIDNYEKAAGTENNILQKLVLLKKAKSLAIANEVLNRQLNIILGGRTSGEEVTRTISRIDEKFRTTQQKANVTIGAGEVPETVISAVAGIFQKAGFNISDNNENSILTANINFLTQPANLNRDDAEFVKWELIIEVINQQSNQSFLTYTTEGRDGAPSYSDALKRADFSARTKIEKDFNTVLNNELLATY